MAEVFRNVGRFKIEDLSARVDEVQNELTEQSWRIGVRAEALLAEHKQDGHAQILLMDGDIDQYVVLDDSRGMEAAMSIEFGRAGYIDPDTGEAYGAMEGLYILTRAASLPRSKGKRLPVERKRRRAKKKKKGVIQIVRDST